MKNSSMIVAKNNPFWGDMQSMLATGTKTSSRTILGDGLVRERYTVTCERDYLSTPFVKLYQNKELLMGLSSDACKVIVHMALTLDYQVDKIKLTAELVGLDRRRLKRGIDELVGRNVIQPYMNRCWYWVNITLMFVGKTPQLSDDPMDV